MAKSAYAARGARDAKGKAVSAKVIRLPSPPGWAALHDADLRSTHNDSPRLAARNHKLPLSEPNRVMARLAELGVREWATEFCERRGYRLREILSWVRHSEYISVRHELWAVIHDTLGMTYSGTARLFGTDHATIRGVVLARHARLIEEGSYVGVAP
jgi:hypothetical protein